MPTRQGGVVSTGSHGSCVAQEARPLTHAGAVPASQGVCAEQCGEFREALAEHTCSWPFLDFRSRDLGRQVRTAPGHTCLPAWDSPGRNGAKRRGASTGLARGASSETPPQSARRGRGSRAPRIPTMRLLPGVGSALQAAAPEWGGGAQAGLRAPPERLWSSSPRQRQFGIYPGPSRHYPPLTAFQGLNADHMQSCPPAQPAARGPPIGSVQDGK